MKRTAWAVQNPWWGSPPHGLHDHRAYPVRAEAIEYMGDAWKKDGETNRQGWQRAYRQGFRIVPVSVVHAD